MQGKEKNFSAKLIHMWEYMFQSTLSLMFEPVAAAKSERPLEMLVQWLEKEAFSVTNSFIYLRISIKVFKSVRYGENSKE